MKGDDADAEPKVDVLLGVVTLRMHVSLFLRLLAGEVLLRQRRPLVGPFVIITDEHDPPFETLTAQGFRGLRAGQAGADNHERAVVAHARLPSVDVVGGAPWAQSGYPRQLARRLARRLRRRLGRRLVSTRTRS